MNYRERYEARRAEGQKRRKRNARASVVTLLASAMVVLIVWFVAGGTKSKEDANASEVSQASQASAPSAATTGEWNLILVNDNSLLPLDYTLPGLVEISPGQEVDERIAEITKKMIADAQEAGVTIQICSAYRSVSHQERLYQREPRRKPGEPTSVQAPRASEHHTGLAIDVVCPEFNRLEEGFEKTVAFRWLDEHAQEYGFILRFLRGKESITGVIYEPWHYRYVGVDHAKTIKEQKICLEEYLQRQ